MHAPWKKSNDKPRQCIKKERHHFADKGDTVKVMVFPVVTYGYESWTIKKPKHQRIDAFKLWCSTLESRNLNSKELVLSNCGAQLLRVPWTVKISNQSILMEIYPEYSLGGLMLKLKLQYFASDMGS